MPDHTTLDWVALVIYDRQLPASLSGSKHHKVYELFAFTLQGIRCIQPCPDIITGYQR